MGYRCDKCGGEIKGNVPYRVSIANDVERYPGMKMLKDAGLCEGCMRVLDLMVDRFLEKRE